MNYKLVIGWLYPELMSTYGDRGNIIVLQKRCEWRGINVGIKKLDLGFNIEDLRKCDLLFMGGAQDRQQKIVSEDLLAKKTTLQSMIDDGIPGLYICGAYQFLGKYYKKADGTIIPGLDILDLYTENPGENNKRLIGNIVIELNRSFDSAQDDNDSVIVGFENHGGRTYLGKNIKQLGKVIKGSGNNGKDATEGAIYKNSFCSYLHGPILPKNPEFADLLIKLALEKKYLPANQTLREPSTNSSEKANGKFRRVNLSSLNDSLETKARDAVLKKLD